MFKMCGEKPSKIYRYAKAFTQNEIFNKELELVIMASELQITYDDNKKQIERFNIATALLKADDGKYYKIQVQNDRSDIDEDMNDKQYVIKEVDYLDVREIGGWESKNYRGQKIVAIYDYYRPKGNGSHKVKISKGEGNRIKIGVYGVIEMTKDNVWIHNYGNLTTKVAGREMKMEDLEKIAADRGLRPAYLRTFGL